MVKLIKVVLILIIGCPFSLTELYSQVNLLSYKKTEIEETLKTICNNNNDTYIEYPNGDVHFKGQKEDTYCYFTDDGIFNLMVIMPHTGELYLSYFAILDKKYKSLSPFKWYYELTNDLTMYKHLIMVSTGSVSIDNKDKNILTYKLIE